MATPSSNQFFEAQHSDRGSPPDPNLFTAAEIVAGSFDSAAVSTATSKAVSSITAAAPDSSSISTADSKAVSGGTRASVADSKTISGSSNASVADSKALSVSVNTSVADSKGVSVANSVPILTVVANSQNVSTADSKAASVATNVGSLPAGRTITTLNAFVSNNAPLNVKDFGALGDGTSHPLSTIYGSLSAAQAVYPHVISLADELDWAAYQAAVNVGATGTTPVARIFSPRGDYRINRQITCPYDRTHIFGEVGPYGTIIRFNPLGAATCFAFGNTHAGNVPQYQCSIRNIGFLSSDSSFKKVAIDVVDGSSFVFDEITVNSWNGAKSTGIRFAGRDMTRFRNLSIYGDKPFQFLPNPYATTLAMDHLHISDTELVAQDGAEPVIDIGDNIGMANFTVDGRNAWGGGSNAIKFNPTTLPTPVLGVHLQNIRYESPTTTGNYAIDWGSSTTTTRNFTMVNCNLGGISGLATNKGLKLRGVYAVSLLNSIYTGGNVGLDMDSSVHDVWLANFVLLDNTTPPLISGLTAVFASQTTGGYATPPTAYYTNDTDAPNTALNIGKKLNMATVTTPTNLNNGDTWFDGTHFYIRIGGVSKQLDN